MMIIEAMPVPSNNAGFISLFTESGIGEPVGIQFRWPFIDTRIDAAKMALQLREAAQVLEDYALEGLPVQGPPSRGYISNLHPTMQEIVADIYNTASRLDDPLEDYNAPMV